MPILIDTFYISKVNYRVKHVVLLSELIRGFLFSFHLTSLPYFQRLPTSVSLLGRSCDQGRSACRYTLLLRGIAIKFANKLANWVANDSAPEIGLDRHFNAAVRAPAFPTQYDTVSCNWICWMSSSNVNDSRLSPQNNQIDDLASSMRAKPSRTCASDFFS